MTDIRKTLRGWRRILAQSSSPDEAQTPGADEGALNRDRAAVDRRIAESTARNVALLTRQVAALQGLIHQQADFTAEALARAGWQGHEEVAQQKQLQRALKAIRGRGDVIAGPWTGEVGFELLYWIPFLNWLSTQGLDGRRLIVVSRGGAAPWYSHLASRYVDLLDLMTADELRRETTESEQKRKQYSADRPFDRRIIETVKAKLALRDDVAVVHPGAMFRLFGALWRKRTTIDLVDAFTSFRALGTPAAPSEPRHEAVAGLPSNYVAAKFYFSAAFPENAPNRAFVADVIRRVSQHAPVALLSTTVRVDDHADFQGTSGSGVYLVDPHTVPQKNLELQTEVVRASRGFIGTYGGFSYLAPFYGIRSVSFFSRRKAFEPHHLDLANRVFDRLLPGGFVALDSRAADLVEPAVARWNTESLSEALT